MPPCCRPLTTDRRPLTSGLEDRIRDIEAAIRIDPARRGLLSAVESAQLGLGHLIAAARDLAEHGRDVGIVTGFAIPTADGPLPETDGPPGAALLADVCRQLGMRARLITDPVALPAVRIAADAIGIPDEDIECCPLDRVAGTDWCQAFLTRARSLTHLVSIERAGPNHTAASILQAAGEAGRDHYCRIVAAADRDCCHNMRGENIDEHTGPLHLLFEGGAKVRRLESTNMRPDFSHSSDSSHPPVRTIGIGDGGNEIGMGTLAWETLHLVVAGGHGPRIACRIATESTIISGTSNWGGFALAGAIALLCDRSDVIDAWTALRHRELLEALVAHGGAIDGVTRERTVTVDGLPFVAYMQPWERIRMIAGLRG